MKKYEYRRYEYEKSDFRTEVVAYDTVYVTYISMGGSGLEIVELKKGESWREGSDEIIEVYDTLDEANIAIERYICEQ